MDSLKPTVFKIHCREHALFGAREVPGERTGNLTLRILPEMFGQDGEGRGEETTSLAKNTLIVGFVSCGKQELFPYSPLQTFLRYCSSSRMMFLSLWFLNCWWFV